MTGGYEVVEGCVDRILGSYETTDVSATESTTTHHDHATTGHSSMSSPVVHTHTQRHTFVNTAREFAMILEVRGRTLKLVHDDYLAVGGGDRVHAVCRRQADGPLLVHEWRNVTRGIRFRTLPTPLAGVAPRAVITLVLLVLGGSFAVTGGAHGDAVFAIVGLALVGAAALLAIHTLAKARELAAAHAHLDRLAR